MRITVEWKLTSFEPWYGAVDTFDKLKEMDLLDDLEKVLGSLYPDGIDEFELNNLFWHESEWLFDNLGVSEEEEEGGK